MRLPVLCLLVWLLMTSANACGQTQPSGHLDPSSHSSGLSLVLFEREAFNTFLGQIPPKCRRENGLGEELMTKIMELAAARYREQRKLHAELNEGWDKASKVERTEIIQAFVKAEDQLVEKQLESLEEVLTPSQQLAVFQEFMRTGNPEYLFDPVPARWLGLEKEEMSEMRRQLEAARHLLERGRALVPDTFSPLPKDMDEELRHRKERMWAALPEEKLIRSFRVLGYLGANEDLTDFLRRSPERKKYLVAEVPAFAVAQLKLEADAKK